MKRRTTLLILLSLILAFAASSERSILAQDVPTAPEAPNEVQAAITPLMSYQGRLMEGGAPVSGVRSMTFNLYNAATLGSSIWNETQSVTVTDGLFQVALGSVSPFLPAVLNQMSQNLWLEINVAGNILPRQQLMGSPYALSLVPGANVTGSTPQSLNVGNTGSGVGIWSYSQSGHGVIASGNGSGVDGTALWVEAYGDNGIAAWTTASSTDASLVVSNNGYGALVKGFGNNGGEHEFMITNDGSFQQELEASGLVKAGVYAYCGKIGSYIQRSFNNVGGTISIANGSSVGECLIDFGFPLANRYFISNAVLALEFDYPSFVTCQISTLSTSILHCYRMSYLGTPIDQTIMVLVY